MVASGASAIVGPGGRLRRRPADDVREIENHLAGQHPQRKQDHGRVGAELAPGQVQEVLRLGFRHRGGHEPVEEPHQDAAEHRKDQPPRRPALALPRQPAIGHGVDDDRDHHQGHTDEQQVRIALGIGQVVDHHADHQRQADAHRKGHGHARHGDGGHQEDVGGVEHRAANERRTDVGRVGLPDVVEKAAAALSDASQAESEDQAHQHDAEHVVPIEQLEPPPRADQLLRVGPGPPAKHRDDAEDDRQWIAFQYEHGPGSPGVGCLFDACGEYIRCAGGRQFSSQEERWAGACRSAVRPFSPPGRLAAVRSGAGAGPLWTTLRLRVGDSCQIVEELGIGLRRAARVANHHARLPQSHQRQAHRHAVVVVGVDPGLAKRCGRDRKPVGLLLHLRPQFAQLRRQCSDPIRLLVADVAHAGDPCRTLRKQGNGRQRLHRVADRVHVDLNAPQRAPPDRDLAVAPADVAAHCFKTIAERDVALKTRAGKPLDGHLAAGDRRGGEEIAGRRGVGFDLVSLGAVHLRRRDREPLQVFDFDRRSERADHRQRHVDVGFRHERAFDVEHHRRQRAGRGHQQSAQELAGDVAGHPRGPARQTVALDDDRRASGALLAGGFGAKLLQGPQQVGDRALLHPPRAVEADPPAAERGQRGQKADRGAAVAHVEIGLGRRRPARTTVDQDRLCRRVVFHRQPELAQRVDHHAGVVAVERAVKNRAAAGQGRANQRAVRDALRARRPDAPADRPGNGDFNRVSHHPAGLFRGDLPELAVAAEVEGFAGDGGRGQHPAIGLARAQQFPFLSRTNHEHLALVVGDVDMAAGDHRRGPDGPLQAHVPQLAAVDGAGAGEDRRAANLVHVVAAGDRAGIVASQTPLEPELLDPPADRIVLEGADTLGRQVDAIAAGRHAGDRVAARFVSKHKSARQRIVAGQSVPGMQQDYVAARRRAAEHGGRRPDGVALAVDAPAGQARLQVQPGGE